VQDMKTVNVLQCEADLHEPVENQLNTRPQNYSMKLETDFMSTAIRCLLWQCMTATNWQLMLRKA